MGKKKTSDKQTLLWSISGEAAMGTSYLFGTMHTHDARIHGFLPSLKPYIAQCSVLCTEFALTENAMPDLPSNLQSTDWWPEVSEKNSKIIIKLLEKRGLGPIHQYRSTTPLLLIQLLTSDLLGKEEAEPLDLALAMHAREQGLTTDGVETFSEQMDTLSLISIQDQCKYLVSIATNFKRFQRQLKKQVQWYLQQDIRKLYKESRRQLGRMRKPLLLERNRIMAGRMQGMIQQMPHFFAIGAAHLAGGKGLLRYLKLQGFTVRPVLLNRE